MVFDSLKDQMTGRDNLTPMQIAQHSLFTARSSRLMQPEPSKRVTTSALAPKRSMKPSPMCAKACRKASAQERY